MRAMPIAIVLTLCLMSAAATAQTPAQDAGRVEADKKAIMDAEAAGDDQAQADAEDKLAEDRKNLLGDKKRFDGIDIKADKKAVADAQADIDAATQQQNADSDAGAASAQLQADDNNLSIDQQRLTDARDKLARDRQFLNSDDAQ